jgi:mono/diheme cytochrome c family protein
MRRIVVAILFTVLSLIAMGALALATWNPAALEPPGRLETAAATRAKRWMVARRARNIRVPAPAAQSAKMGEMQFAARCQVCHGIDGRTPTDLGLAMNPRATDLGSADVQRYSDAELFWIIRNGIRLSGMPGFGQTLSDEEIWPLVHYVRSVKALPKP